MINSKMNSVILLRISEQRGLKDVVHTYIFSQNEISLSEHVEIRTLIGLYHIRNENQQYSVKIKI